MRKWFKFFGLVLVVLTVREWLRLKNDLGFLVVYGKTADYYYLSPARDRYSLVKIDLEQKKPKELDNLTWWLFYTYGIRVQRVFKTNPLKVPSVSFLREYFFVNGRVPSEREIDNITSETVRRDFSDASVDKLKLEIVIINATGINGLATRLSEILKMNGLLVTKVITDKEDAGLICELSGPKKYLDIMAKLPIDRCNLAINTDSFVTLKVGAKAGRMVQYLLYGRSF